MTVKELYKTLRYCSQDAEVVITLKDPSVGARASVGVKSAGMGIDHEHNQFRIEPSEKLYRNILRMEEPAGTDKIGGIIVCKKCLMKVAKTDRYCKNCGQRLR